MKKVPETTTIDSLIKELQEARERHGNIPVAIGGRALMFVDVLPYYYDGGWVYPDSWNEAGAINYKSSKAYTDKGSYKQGEHEFCAHLKTVGPDNDEDSINGKYLRRLFPEIYEFKETQEEEERAKFNGQIVRYKWHNERSLLKRALKTKYVPVEAYLDDGTMALATCMKDARERLEKKYAKKMLNRKLNRSAFYDWLQGGK